MITRNDIRMAIYGQDLQNLDQATDAVFKLIEADQAQYAALVDAAVLLRTGCKRENLTHLSRKVWDLAGPFIEPKLSEKLDKLADDTNRNIGWIEVTRRVRQLAAEARILEGEEK